MTGAVSYLFLEGYLYPLVIRSIEASLKDKTGVDTNIESIDISIFPTVIGLNHISASLENDVEAKIKIKNLRFYLNPLQAIGGTIVINRIAVAEPDLSIAIANTDRIAELLKGRKLSDRVRPSFFKPDVRSVRIEGGKIGLEISERGRVEIAGPSLVVEKSNIFGWQFGGRIESGSAAYKNITEDFSNLEFEGSLTGKAFNIKKMHLENAGDRLEGDFNYLIKDGFAEGRIRGKISLAKVAAYIKKAPPLKGQANISFDFFYRRSGELTATADLGVGKGEISGISIHDLIGNFSLKDQLLEIKRLELKTLDGRSRAKGSLDLSNGNYSIDGNFEEIEVPWLTERTGLRIKNGTSGRFRGSGNINAKTLTGALSAKIGGLYLKGQKKTTSPISISTDLDMRDKDIELKKALVSSVGLEGKIKGKISNLEFPDLEVDVAAKNISAFSFLFEPSLAGKASLKGRLFGQLRKPSFQGFVDFTKPSVRGFSAESVSGDIFYENRVLKTENAEIRGENSIINLRGKSDFAPEKPVLDISVSILRGDIEELIQMAGQNYRIRGNLSGTLKLSGPLLSPYIAGNIQADALNVYDESIDSVLLSASYDRGDVSLKRLEVRKAKGELRASGKLHMEKDVDIDAEAKGIELGDIIYLKKYTVGKGTLNGRFHIGGTAKKPAVKGSIEVDKLEAYDERIDFLFASGSYSEDLFHIEAFEVEKGDSFLAADGSIDTKGTVNLEVKIDDLDFENINLKSKGLPELSGKIDLFGKIEGSALSPNVSGDVDISGFGIKDSGITVNVKGNIATTADIKKPVRSKGQMEVQIFEISTHLGAYRADAPFTLRYDGNTFALGDVRIEGEAGFVRVGGKAGTNGSLNFSVSGETKIDGLEKYLKAIAEMGGYVIFDAHVKGSVKNPEITAMLDSEKGMVRFIGFPYDLVNIRSKMSISGQNLVIEELKGELEGSKFTGGGVVVLNAFPPGLTDLFFDIDEVGIRFPSWLSSRGKGRITVKGKGKNIVLGGDIEILRASYTEKIDLKELLRKAARKPAPKAGKEIRETGFSLNMYFRADDNIIVRNELADIEMRGYLNLIGPPRDLTLLGELETLNGKVYFRDNEFSILRGMVTFSDPEKITPFFDVNAEAVVKDYQINISVIGKPEDYTIEMSSNPFLEEKDIVSLLTFGFTGGELKGQGTEMTSIEAVSLILQGELEEKVKRFFGFDRFRLDPYYSESSGSTEARVTVGKELMENVTATYSRALSNLGEEEVTVEYQMNKNLSLMGSWLSSEENVGAFGGDVILRFEFE